MENKEADDAVLPGGGGGGGDVDEKNGGSSTSVTSVAAAEDESSSVHQRLFPNSNNATESAKNTSDCNAAAGADEECSDESKSPKNEIISNQAKTSNHNSNNSNSSSNNNNAPEEVHAEESMRKVDMNDVEATMTTKNWDEILGDANELESLVFCLRRPTARKRLFQFINNLRMLSSKLKRHEEVTRHLNSERDQEEGTAATAAASITTAIDETEKSSVNKKKRRIDDDIVEQKEQPQAKKPRAIPLESMTEQERELMQMVQSGMSTKGATAMAKTNIRSGSGSGSGSENDPNSVKHNENGLALTLAMPNSFDPMTKTPILKAKDTWVIHHNRRSRLHCPDFEATNTCPLGSKCAHLHIYTPRYPNSPVEIKTTSKDGTSSNNTRLKILIYAKEDLDRAYEKHRDISLTKSNILEKIKNDELNNPNYSCSFVCPLDGTIYYAQPFPGDKVAKANKSIQGIWWYRSMKEAKEALATIVIRDLQQRKIVPSGDVFLPLSMDTSLHGDFGKKMAMIKAAQMSRRASTSASKIVKKRIAPPILPEIKPWNWMETDYGERCELFHSPQKCPYGNTCKNAHVFFPTKLNHQSFPRREALCVAYMENFQLTLEDSFFQGTNGRNPKSPFRVMTAIDNRGTMWYTAALKCPREATIYYAAGGNTGCLNKQNMCLYPRVEDAKLAVAGIVLDSFVARGLKGDRNGVVQERSIKKSPVQKPRKNLNMNMKKTKMVKNTNTRNTKVNGKFKTRVMSSSRNMKVDSNRQMQAVPSMKGNAGNFGNAGNMGMMPMNIPRNPMVMGGEGQSFPPAMVTPNIPNMGNMQYANPGNMQQANSGNIQNLNSGNMQHASIGNVQQGNSGNRQYPNTGIIQHAHTGNMQQANSGNMQHSNTGNMQNSNSGNRQYSNTGNIQNSNPGNMQPANIGIMQQASSGNRQYPNSGNMQQANSGFMQHANTGKMQQTNSGNMQHSNTGNMQNSNSGNMQHSNTGNMQNSNSGNMQHANTGNIQNPNLGIMQHANTGNMQNLNPGNRSHTNAGNMQHANTGNMQNLNPGNIQHTNTGNMQNTNSGNMQYTNPGNMQQTNSGNMQHANAGNMQYANPGNMQQTNSGNIQHTNAGNMQHSNAGNMHHGNPGGMKMANMNMMGMGGQVPTTAPVMTNSSHLSIAPPPPPPRPPPPPPPPARGAGNGANSSGNHRNNGYLKSYA